MSDSYYIYGLLWRVGRVWGQAHPEHTCYSDATQVDVSGNVVNLGIGLRPAELHGRQYAYTVGYLRTQTTIKYGTLDVLFRLPKGKNLWPAIWLDDPDHWLPEIDIMEAWSGRQLFPLRKRAGYRRLPLMNYILPTVHWGTAENHRQRSGGIFGKATPWTCIHENAANRCRLLWTPEEIVVEYNGHKVMDFNEAEALQQFNESKGLQILLNNYVTNAFCYDDLRDMERAGFCIYDLKYKPL